MSDFPRVGAYRDGEGGVATGVENLLRLDIGDLDRHAVLLEIGSK